MGVTMRIEQLRMLCEIVDQGFSISRAALALGTSQPGISKQIRLLETELKVDLLLRRAGRITGLTDPGAAALAVARRMVRDASNLRSIGDDYTRGESGRLVLATQHFLARYTLTAVIERFCRRYPEVQVVLRQGTQRQTLDLLRSGEADIGLLSRPPDGILGGVVQLPGRTFSQSVIVPCDHPLLKARRVTLADIAGFPLILLDPSMTGGWSIARAFEAAAIDPTVVITAGDMDVIKAYVARGLGIAILPTMAVDPQHDPELRTIAADHLFEPIPNFVGLNPDTFLRGYMYELIAMVLPEWTRPRVARRLAQAGAEG
jgi:LysR family cys regulon transcriptional activator